MPLLVCEKKQARNWIVRSSGLKLACDPLFCWCEVLADYDFSQSALQGFMKAAPIVIPTRSAASPGTHALIFRLNANLCLAAIFRHGFRQSFALCRNDIGKNQINPHNKSSQSPIKPRF